MHRVGTNNISSNCQNGHYKRNLVMDTTHLTGPISSNFAFVSSLKGVDASTHTSPFFNLMAVDRPPTGNSPKRANGL